MSTACNNTLKIITCSLFTETLSAKPRP